MKLTDKNAKILFYTVFIAIYLFFTWKIHLISLCGILFALGIIE